MQYRYVRHLDNLIALAGKEIERTRWQPEFHHLALMYHERFTRAREMFVNQYGNNLLKGFRRFFETGKLELITCGATHGFLPLMQPLNRHAARAQIEIGCREFERHFGRRPLGMWLPECGYTAGVDELLRDAGIRYFFVDTHAVMFAEPRPKLRRLCADHLPEQRRRRPGPRYRIVQAGLERHRRISRRLQLS